ncbi:MAG TPA: metallophosphoesterase [Kofleriaceae bacterium]
MWKGDVPAISPVEREAFKTCGRGKVTVEGGKRLQRLPYLQSITTTSAVVAFAAWPGDIWVEARKGDEVAATARARFAGSDQQRRRSFMHRDDRQALSPDHYFVQRADLDGLEPRTLYCYRVMSRQGPLTDPAPLVTAAPPGQEDPVRFVMLGDTGSGSAAQQAIARRIAAEPFDFLVFLGDLAYEQGTAEQLQTRFFEVYKDYLQFAPVFPVMGNHDRRTRNGGPYLEAFVLPPPELYYSFDWGDVHIVVLDTTGGYREQIEWLKRDLSGNRKRFTIAVGHHPMYTGSIRGPHLALRRRFWPVLAFYGVNLVVMGHEHHYERFARRNGIIHIVSGGGGGRLTRIYSKASTVRTATIHHYLAFEVTKNKLTMRAIDIEGKEFDKVELEWRSHKEGSPPERQRREPRSPVDVPVASAAPPTR